MFCFIDCFIHFIDFLEQPQSQVKEDIYLDNMKKKDNGPLTVCARTGKLFFLNALQIGEKQYFHPLEEHRHWCTWTMKILLEEIDEEMSLEKRGYQMVTEQARDILDFASRKDLCSSEKYVSWLVFDMWVIIPRLKY